MPEALTLEFIRAYLDQYGPKPDPATSTNGAGPQAAPAQATDHTVTYAEIEDALRCLPPHLGPNSYNDWLDILKAVHSVLGDAGVELCNRYIGNPDKPHEIADKFKTFSGSGVTIASLFHFAKRYGWTPPQRAAPLPDLPELPYDEIAAILLGEPLRFHSAWPYGIEDTMLVRYVETKDGETKTIVIADFAATITAEVTDEDGAKTFEICGTATRGGPFRLEVDATIFGHDSKLRAALEAAAGARDPVRSDQAKHLGPAIKLLTRDDQLAQVRRYRRTGWLQNIFLLPGSEQAGVQIDLPHKLPYATQTGDVDAALPVLDRLLQAVDPRISTPIVAMLLQAPLHRVAGWLNERYAIFVQGRTGSLKTSFCQTAMCLYGPGFAHSDNLIKWGEGATRNAVMAFATRAHDMPLLIDNYKPNTGGGDKDFINLIHNILEGGEKDRLNRASELKEAKPVHCFPLITGEDTPATDPASLARVLVLKFEWQRGAANPALTYAQDRSQMLCAIGDAWISWLEAEAGRAVAESYAGELNTRRAWWADYLRSLRPDMVNILRVATSLAVNELTWQIACYHPGLGSLLSRYTEAHFAGLQTIAATMADQTTEALAALRYLDALRELVTTGQALLVPRPVGVPTDPDRDRMIGWRDSDGIYLLPKLALHAVKRLLGPGELADSPQTIYAQLDSLGLLAGKDKQQTTRQIKIGGANKRVLHIKPGAFDAADDDGDGDNMQLEDLGL